MLVVAGLKNAGVFDLLVRRLLALVRTTRALSIVLMAACFFSSMLITNDVSLITFVPLAVMVLRRAGQEKLLIPVIVLQTVAANLGSMLTPLGNPQNLYLYSVSGMSMGRFLAVMALPTALSLVLLLLCCLAVKKESIVPVQGDGASFSRRSAVIFALLFVLCLLTVVHLLHYALVLAVIVAAVAFLEPALLKKADYALLLTFIFFFIFVGNMKAIPAISEALSALVGGRELTVGILLSQIISNVPAAMLLSGFTADYVPLLLGVNLGGLGTLIASMASLISYKLYAATENARPGRYMAVFTLVNVAFLAVLWAVTALVLPLLS